MSRPPAERGSSGRGSSGRDSSGRGSSGRARRARRASATGPRAGAGDGVRPTQRRVERGKGDRSRDADDLGSATARGSQRPWYLRVPVIGGIVVAVVVGLVAAAWFTPMLGVRTIEVIGTEQISEQEITAALDIPLSQPLPRVDTAAAAERVAAIARVESARVQRIYPSTVRVTVVERVAMVFIDGPDGTHLLDKEGVDFAVEPPPPGLPRLVTASPGWGDPATAAALEILQAMPQQLREQVAEIIATSISDVAMTMHDGRMLMWGGVDHSSRKGAVALPLLTQPGQIYDVSSPDLPTVR
ncbi:MAG: FtsQ-type POTRA domain-containing protein [Rhodococcus sp.]|nr:FtsQ-type POTRA domain-containing protein [Rhodococcus sp. (in: high G+C Gram-positive bacteria)]